MKRYFVLIVVSMLSLLLVACKNDSENSSINPTEIAQNEEIETTEEIVLPTETAVKINNSEFSFADLNGVEFCLASGASGGYTILTVNEDGTFSGYYHDGEMGNTGEEYPDGTVYESNFSGRLKELEKVDDYTFKCRVEYINYDNEPGEKIKDGIRYIYTKAFGLENADDLNIYLPGKPLEELSENFMTWMTMKYSDNETSKVLYFYALHNIEEDLGFYSKRSYEKSREFEIELEEVEKTTAEIRYLLFTSTRLTQNEMNKLAKNMFDYWDSLINSQWSILKNTLDADTMALLTEEQLEWIDKKENEAITAGKKYEGGSMEPMERYLTEAELTKERVYELAEYLK